MRKTSNQYALLLLFAEISMVSSLISKNFSKLVENFLTTTTFSWEITWTEDTTPSKPCHFWYALRSDIQAELLSLEETTRVNRSHKFMGFMMNASGSMEMQTFGNISLDSSIICHLQVLLKETFSAFMVVFLHQLIHLIKLTNLIELWKCQQKVQFVISYGQTQMTDVVGVYLQEELDTHSVKI